MEAYGLSGPFPSIHDGVWLAVSMAGIATRGTDGNAMGMCGVDSDGFRRVVPIRTTMGITIPVRTTDDTT